MGDALKIFTIFGQILPMHIVKSRLVTVTNLATLDIVHVVQKADNNYYTVCFQ